MTNRIGMLPNYTVRLYLVPIVPAFPFGPCREMTGTMGTCETRIEIVIVSLRLAGLCVVDAFGLCHALPHLALDLAQIRLPGQRTLAQVGAQRRIDEGFDRGNASLKGGQAALQVGHPAVALRAAARGTTASKATSAIDRLLRVLILLLELLELLLFELLELLELLLFEILAIFLLDILDAVLEILYLLLDLDHTTNGHIRGHDRARRTDIGHC